MHCVVHAIFMFAVCSALQLQADLQHEALALKSVVIAAPWGYKREPERLPSGWQKHKAEQNIVVDYIGHTVTIPEGDFYFTFNGKVAIGWHGTYNPPCGM